VARRRRDTFRHRQLRRAGHVIRLTSTPNTEPALRLAGDDRHAAACLARGSGVPRCSGSHRRPSHGLE
jgi:hypothetical protein